MGLFDFLKNFGKKVDKGAEAEQIKADIETSFGDKVENLSVLFTEDTVVLTGKVDSQATREKVVLLAGNVKGVEKVNDDGLTVKPPPVEEEEEEPTLEPAFTFYTIQPGDSLSKIAKKYYGDALKWPTLFEANREVIKDPDLIYPGQQIRVPPSADA